MITIRDVAKKAGVSVTTVSNVLANKSGKIPVSEKTKSKIMRVVEKVDYHPNIYARYLRTKSTGIVAVMVTDIKDYFFNTMIDEIEQVLEKNGYYFILISAQNSPQKEKLYLNKVRKTRVDGLLVLSGTVDISDNMIRELSRDKMPMVLIARRDTYQSISSVDTDELMGGFLATEHLISLGHRNIMHITTFCPRVDAEDRLKGYTRAMQKHGLRKKCWIEKGILAMEGGYKTMTNVLRRGKNPTAIFTFNDRMAFGAMNAIRDEGLEIPEDIAVVGFDDIPFATYSYPSLTTIRQPISEMGKRGVQLLLGDIKGDRSKKNQHVVLESELIIRKSSGSKLVTEK